MKYLLLIFLVMYPIKAKHHIIKDYDSEIDMIVTKDVKCLADNIYHEAKGESLKGKIGVAQVTINRVNSEHFPDSICDVVYERTKIKRKILCQFSWTCETGKYIVYNEQYEDALNIALAFTYNDAKYDILQHSLFFHADYVRPKWKKKPITKIGRHIFY